MYGFVQGISSLSFCGVIFSKGLGQVSAADFILGLHTTLIYTSQPSKEIGGSEDGTNQWNSQELALSSCLAMTCAMTGAVVNGSSQTDSVTQKTQ